MPGAQGALKRDAGNTPDLCSFVILTDWYVLQWCTVAASVISRGSAMGKLVGLEDYPQHAHAP